MRRLAWLLWLGLGACGGAEAQTEGVELVPGSWLEDPSGPLPAALADVGLFLEPQDWDVVPDAAVVYEPRWPLWSSGSLKLRHLVVPQGATVDNRSEAWAYPPGTAFFKTFFYPRDGVSVPVETRVMHVLPDGSWDYADYAWDEPGRTATLIDITFPTPVEVETDSGRLLHTIPARLECRECHESAPSFVLGFEALQLGDGVGSLPVAFTDALPEEPPTIEAADPQTVEVLGMFVGQCVHCHNGSDGASSSFDLRPDVALANTIDQETESSAAAAGIRIIPGDPDDSALFQAFSGETDDPEVNEMPPLGIDRRDAAAVELLRSWIAGL